MDGFDLLILRHARRDDVVNDRFAQLDTFFGKLTAVVTASPSETMAVIIALAYITGRAKMICIPFVPHILAAEGAAGAAFLPGFTACKHPVVRQLFALGSAADGAGLGRSAGGIRKGMTGRRQDIIFISIQTVAASMHGFAPGRAGRRDYFDSVVVAGCCAFGLSAIGAGFGFLAGGVLPRVTGGRRMRIHIFM